MSGKQENMRELDREEMSKVNAGAGAATASTENGTPIPIDPEIPGPIPVPQDDTGLDTKCQCGHCGYIINSNDAAGKYYFVCPNCKHKANWIHI